jgi:glycosyltransferase involved in cell wall biosynthesis
MSPVSVGPEAEVGQYFRRSDQADGSWHISAHRAPLGRDRSAERTMGGMTPSVFLNGRFLRQSMTGVQRFSSEIALAIDRLAAVDQWPGTVVLAPRLADPVRGGPAVPYRHLRVREVGRMRGHLWEQVELPGAARGGILVNLGNTGPVLAGQRQVVVIHDASVFDTPESYSLRFRAWYKGLQRGLVQTGAHIVTVSEFSRQRIAARLRIDPARIAVIYEGADHILRVVPDPGTLERHGLRPREFALVVASRAAHKNFEALRETAAALERRGMVIAIAGGSNSDVFRSIPGWDFAARRLGRVSDAELRALYENAACLLFPSRYEGFGLPPVEAMACGCPVLAARGGAVEEICADGALYFANNERRPVTDMVELLLDEDGFAAQLRERGRARAAALSWDASASALGDVLRRIQYP